MANDSDSDGGFGWGLLIGLVVGVVAGAYLASGPGRSQVETLTTRTIELTGDVRRPDSPVRRAISEGIGAARRRREELEQAIRAPGQEIGPAQPRPPEAMPDA